MNTIIVMILSLMWTCIVSTLGGLLASATNGLDMPIGIIVGGFVVIGFNIISDSYDDDTPTHDTP